MSKEYISPVSRTPYKVVKRDGEDVYIEPTTGQEVGLDWIKENALNADEVNKASKKDKKSKKDKASEASDEDSEE